MSFFTLPLKRLSVLTCVLLGCAMFLTACGDDKPAKPEEEKDERSPQERVLILKQRFEQVDTALKEMEKDLEIQKKRVDNTRELVDSIRHSLTKGGLKGYNLENISTTDPVLLAAVAKEQADRKARKDRKEAKEDTDDSILNGLLIACFLLIIGAIFWVALKERKNIEPLPSQVMPPYSPDTQPDSDVADAYDADITPGIDDTGSFEYGELRPPQPKPDDDNPAGPNSEQPL